tara:strand:+ start:1274 stop:1546 length:273 start_codon:yes stop_codon:yes gene_type:complete
MIASCDLFLARQNSRASFYGRLFDWSSTIFLFMVRSLDCCAIFLLSNAKVILKTGYLVKVIQCKLKGQEAAPSWGLGNSIWIKRLIATNG